MSADVERYSWGIKSPAGWIFGPGSRHLLEGDGALVDAAREIATLQTENSDLRKAIAALEAAAKARDQR